jgi:serine/threonine protein phosphatase PrpC
MGPTCHFATDVGRRRAHNEDAYLVDDSLRLYVVADGMGGHACGEIASGLAVHSFRDYVEERREVVLGYCDASPSVPIAMVRRLLEDALHAACRAVYGKAQENPDMRGMGTTLVAMLVTGDRGFVVHVGDSRAYLVRDGRAVRLTRDHSVLNELVASGEITAEIANTTYAGYRHSLSRAVGVCEDVEVDSMDFEILPDDVLLLASDGLTQYVDDEELPTLVRPGPGDLAAKLVALANDRGGNDNITTIALRLASASLATEDEVKRRKEFAAKISAIRSMTLFRQLDYAELMRLLAATEMVAARTGDVIAREGQAANSMYVVLSGRVAIERGGRKIGESGAGTHFGDVSLMSRAPRATTATAVSETRLLRLRRDHMFALARREPEIAVKLLLGFAEAAAQRGQDTTQAIGEFRALVAGGTVDAI